MTPEKDILKYLKVKALAERGEPGERRAASRIMAKLEADNPSLARDAASYQRKQEQSSGDSPPPGQPHPAGVWPKEGAAWGEHPPPHGTGNWENIFKWAGAAFNQAYGFAETVANAVAGRQLAQEARATTKLSRSGNILITIRMPLWVYEQASNLNPVQQQAFRQAMHELLEEELDDFLGD